MNEQVIPQNAQIVQSQPSVDYNIFIQELTNMTRKFELFLVGEEEIIDENRRPKTIKTSNSKCNVEGRKAIMSWVNNYVNPNTYLAENKQHNVENIYKLDSMNTLTLLYTHLNEFEMTIEDANDVHSQLCELMFHALQRSITDKKYIFPTISTNYQGNQQQQSEKPKWLGLF
jgi:hypothetical protein